MQHCKQSHLIVKVSEVLECSTYLHERTSNGHPSVGPLTSDSSTHWLCVIEPPSLLEAIDARHSVESDLPEDFRGLRKGRENKESRGGRNFRSGE